MLIARFLNKCQNGKVNVHNSTCCDRGVIFTLITDLRLLRGSLMKMLLAAQLKEIKRVSKWYN